MWNHSGRARTNVSCLWQWKWVKILFSSCCFCGVLKVTNLSPVPVGHSLLFQGCAEAAPVKEMHFVLALHSILHLSPTRTCTTMTWRGDGEGQLVTGEGNWSLNGPGRDCLNLAQLCAAMDFPPDTPLQAGGRTAPLQHQGWLCMRDKTAQKMYFT